MAFGDAQPVDFNYFLNRKYALQQQAADADTSRAGSAAVGAAATALTAGADARLANTRSDLLPAESKAQIGLQGAQTNLFNNQAQVVVPDSQSQNALRAAQTGQTQLQSKVLQHVALDPLLPDGLPSVGSALGGVLGGSTLPSLGTTSDAAPTPTAQKPGESYSAWVARLKASGY